MLEQRDALKSKHREQLHMLNELSHKLQSLLNAAVGVVATRAIERGPEWWRRRQYTRRTEGRRFAR